MFSSLAFLGASGKEVHLRNTNAICLVFWNQYTLKYARKKVSMNCSWAKHLEPFERGIFSSSNTRANEEKRPFQRALKIAQEQFMETFILGHLSVY